jgi:hypothetical protein
VSDCALRNEPARSHPRTRGKHLRHQLGLELCPVGSSLRIPGSTPWMSAQMICLAPAHFRFLTAAVNQRIDAFAASADSVPITNPNFEVGLSPAVVPSADQLPMQQDLDLHLGFSIRPNDNCNALVCLLAAMTAASRAIFKWATESMRFMR